MSDILDLAGDVLSAGAALAGLLLVYIGAVTASYGAYPAVNQPDVRPMYLRRAWFGLVGFMASLLASAFALSAKLFAAECLAITSLILIFAAFIAVAATAVWTVLDI